MKKTNPQLDVIIINGDFIKHDEKLKHPKNHTIIL